MYISTRIYSYLSVSVAHFLSNMARYAVFGDSYVRRLGEFGGNYDVEGEVECFGVGGMRTDSIPNLLWQKIEEFAQTHVFIHLGWNDYFVNFITQGDRKSAARTARSFSEELKRKLKLLYNLISNHPDLIYLEINTST